MPRKYVRHKPLPTKEWTEQEIDKFYTKKKVKNSILNIEVDKTRNDMMSTNQIKEIYNRYNINYYATYRDFRNSFIEDRKQVVDGKEIIKKIQTVPDEMIQEMYKAYQHRDALIRTGQYEEIRIEMYKNSYMKSLEAIGISKAQRDLIDKLPLSVWKDVASVPNPDKTSISSTKLPHLGGFSYSTKGDEVKDIDAENIWKDVLAAFDITDIPVINQEFEDVKKRYVNVVRIIPKERRKNINEKSIKDYEQSSISLVSPFTKKDKKRVKKSKKGNLYIPFVGSQRAGSKNQDIVTDIINEFLHRGLKYSDFVEGWDDTSEK